MKKKKFLVLSTAIVFAAASSFMSMAAPVQVSTSQITSDSEGYAIYGTGPMVTLDTGFENSNVMLLQDAYSRSSKQDPIINLLSGEEFLEPVYEVSIDATCTVPRDCEFRVSPRPWILFSETVNSELNSYPKAGEVVRLFNQGVSEVIYDEEVVSMYDLIYLVELSGGGTERDSLDWKDFGTDSIITKVLDHPHLGNGSIILMHNGAKYTPAALETIITGLKAKGYELVPISELIVQNDFHVDHEGRQISNEGP